MRGKYLTWTPADILALREGVLSGLTNKEIGEIMGRPWLSIARAISRFKLTRTPTQRMKNILRGQANVDRSGPKNGNWKGGVSDAYRFKNARG